MGRKDKKIIFFRKKFRRKGGGGDTTTISSSSSPLWGLDSIFPATDRSSTLVLKVFPMKFHYATCRLGKTRLISTDPSIYDYERPFHWAEAGGPFIKLCSVRAESGSVQSPTARALGVRAPNISIFVACVYSELGLVVTGYSYGFQDVLADSFISPSLFSLRVIPPLHIIPSQYLSRLFLHSFPPQAPNTRKLSQACHPAPESRPHISSRRPPIARQRDLHTPANAPPKSEADLSPYRTPTPHPSPPGVTHPSRTASVELFPSRIASALATDGGRWQT
ncbi:hypothetical protein C8R44DRAFT_846750 [Mycena epipterygia]|nr:hypothetical protein C8R44DRAFT_846750 [Mycena epipterygia]